MKRTNIFKLCVFLFKTIFFIFFFFSNEPFLVIRRIHDAAEPPFCMISPVLLQLTAKFAQVDQAFVQKRLDRCRTSSNSKLV